MTRAWRKVRTEGKLLSGICRFANMRNWRVILVWALCVGNTRENSACQLVLAICFCMVHTVGVGNGGSRIPDRRVLRNGCTIGPDASESVRHTADTERLWSFGL